MNPKLTLEKANTQMGQWETLHEQKQILKQSGDRTFAAVHWKPHYKGNCLMEQSHSTPRKLQPNERCHVHELWKETLQVAAVPSQGHHFCISMHHSGNNMKGIHY